MKISIVTSDATLVEADVLTLKFAGRRYGLDREVAKRLRQVGIPDEAISPEPGEASLVPSEGCVAARNVLFVGTPPLDALGYADIRVFARETAEHVFRHLPDARTIAGTLHGANNGFDEMECFQAMLAGLMDARNVPDHAEFLIVERDLRRANRLRPLLQVLQPEGDFVARQAEMVAKLQNSGRGSQQKPHVFVAMPFADQFDDVYHYGIQNAVNSSGCLCERADHSSFTGAVMNWVQERIRTARLVIADMTGANANVYLEVGYAWGCNVPTVLVVQDTSDLKFDVSGHRCIVYKRIQQLEAMLTKELASVLSQSGDDKSSPK